MSQASQQASGRPAFEVEDGLGVADTIAVAIVGAEYIMRWLPRGTHEWDRFITPDELEELLKNAGLEPVDRKGFVFNPLTWNWSLSERDLSVNYVTTCVKPA